MDYFADIDNVNFNCDVKTEMRFSEINMYILARCFALYQGV